MFVLTVFVLVLFKVVSVGRQCQLVALVFGVSDNRVTGCVVICRSGSC